MLPIVDAHTHAFPPDIIGDRERTCERDVWFNQLYANPNALLTGEAELLQSMERSEIDHAIIAGFPWADPGLCREHNNWMADVCSRHPERFSYLAIVSPTDRQANVDAATAFEHGALGIGELNADAQGFSLERSADTAAVVEVCSNVDKPIMFHASEPVGHIYPGKGNATPDQFVTWLADHPHQRVVLAHWGGGLPFYELMPEIRELTKNIAYDCAATTYLYDFRVFKTVINIIGANRVIFGSDFPVLGQRRLVRRVKAIVDVVDQPEVFAENARRVYGLAKEGSV